MPCAVLQLLLQLRSLHAVLPYCLELGNSWWLHTHPQDMPQTLRRCGQGSSAQAHPRSSCCRGTVTAAADIEHVSVTHCDSHMFHGISGNTACLHACSKSETFHRAGFSNPPAGPALHASAEITHSLTPGLLGGRISATRMPSMSLGHSHSTYIAIYCLCRPTPAPMHRTCQCHTQHHAGRSHACVQSHQTHL